MCLLAARDWKQHPPEPGEQLSYLDWHDYAAWASRQGIRQRRCYCRLYLWPHETPGHAECATKALNLGEKE